MPPLLILSHSIYVTKSAPWSVDVGLNSTFLVNKVHTLIHNGVLGMQENVLVFYFSAEMVEKLETLLYVYMTPCMLTKLMEHLCLTKHYLFHKIKS